MPISALGTFFTTTSGPGTFVAQQAAITAFSDTGPLWVIFNRAPPGGQSIYLRWLKLLLGGTAPTATVSLDCAVRTDVGPKVPTGATQFANPASVNVDGRDGTLSVATYYAYTVAAAMVTPASSASVRQCAYGRIPTSLGIVGDEYTFEFGTTESTKSMVPGLTATRATAAAQLSEKMAPVVIAPGTWATIHLWWLTAATNAPSWSWEIGHYEAL